jgi:hypothetical protein
LFLVIGLMNLPPWHLFFYLIKFSDLICSIIIIMHLIYILLLCRLHLVNRWALTIRKTIRWYLGRRKVWIWRQKLCCQPFRRSHIIRFIFQYSFIIDLSLFDSVILVCMSLVFSFDGYSIWFSTSYVKVYKIVNSSGLCIYYNIYDNISMLDLKYIYICLMFRRHWLVLGLLNPYKIMLQLHLYYIFVVLY